MEEIENRRLQFFNAMDTDELGDIWKKNDRAEWSDDAFNLIEKILRDRGQPLEEQASTDPSADPYRLLHEKKGPFFARFWRGEEPLAVAYWVHGVLPSVALSTLSRIGQTSWIVLIVALLVWAIYFPIAWVGIWRSAGRYRGRKVWAVLARLNVVIGFMSIVAVIVGMLAL